MLVRDSEGMSIQIEVKCIGCLKLMTPNTTCWPLFRAGIHVHDREDCQKIAHEKLAGK